MYSIKGQRFAKEAFRADYGIKIDEGAELVFTKLFKRGIKFFNIAINAKLFSGNA